MVQGSVSALQLELQLEVVDLEVVVDMALVKVKGNQVKQLQVEA